jgi:uncharacterized membrane protein YhaH (DUF805 family)
MFKNVFSFQGRIRRMEYGISYLIYMVFSVIADLISEYYIPNADVSRMFILLLYIPLIWFMLAQGSKRCHDRGNSGWYQIIPFYAFWMLFADGDIGPNEYGDNPKGISMRLMQ